MLLLNQRENPNAIAGIFFLILLGVFAGPTVLPELIATTLPFADEGVACDWLRTGEDRAQQQSLIGRAASDDPQDPPFLLEVRTGPVPGPGGNLTITIVMLNDSLGTVAFLEDEGQLILNPGEARNGFGVIFGDGVIPQGVGEAATTYSADRIRLLGPRQRCIHRVNVPIDQIPNNSVLVAENVTIRAFYRNTNAGQLPLTGTNVYADQGLWTGLVESEPTRLNSG